MRLLCGPASLQQPSADGDLRIVLFDPAVAGNVGSAGHAALREVQRRHLEPDPRAWDFLAIALSVLAADFAGARRVSSDGWTREFQLDVAVADVAFWTTQADALEAALAFLTTDRWRLCFHSGGVIPPRPRKVVIPKDNCVVLLSGGLDSLIGAIDLVKMGERPLAVSQVVRGDAEKQIAFAQDIGGGLSHLQLNHNVCLPCDEDEPSQRARSIIFLSFGVLAATTLSRYRDGDTVPLYVCENGFIAINPPLTPARIGSLSTRTAHPAFLAGIQRVLDAADLRVSIQNPYALKTKGEMLRECADQKLLRRHAAQSTSCGRFQRFSYRHCGRCVPCQVRRAAFIAARKRDNTAYVYGDIGRNDKEHALFDDVRSVAMAIVAAHADFEEWLGTALTATNPDDREQLRSMIMRGIKELKRLHRRYKVK